MRGPVGVTFHGHESAVCFVFFSQIWVHSGHNASGYFTVYGDEALQSDHFSSRLSFGDTQTVWARTGYLGFLRRTELTDACGGEAGGDDPVTEDLVVGRFMEELLFFSVSLRRRRRRCAG